MLRTNSKEANERIKDYVCNNVNFDTDTVNEKYYYVMDLEKRHKNGENIDMFQYMHTLFFQSCLRKLLKMIKEDYQFINTLKNGVKVYQLVLTLVII